MDTLTGARPKSLSRQPGREAANTAAGDDFVREFYRNRGDVQPDPLPEESRERLSQPARGGVLRNPSTKGAEWYHGTKASGEQLAQGFREPRYDAETERHFPVAHWNALLGSHFAAHHSAANRFAGPAAGGLSDPRAWKEHNQTPSVVHARLHITNPKVYRSEDDMTDEVYEHEHAAGNHIDKYLARSEDPWEDFSHNTIDFEGDSQRKIPRGEMHHYEDDWEGDDPPDPAPRRELWLNAHPDKEGIARRFKERLQAAGHDGIIYGNAWEHERVRSSKPESNQVAIAFHPHQVEITKHHVFGDEHKTAAARWSPSSGVFGPTTGHDPILFDGDELRPEVRRDVMERLDQALRVDTGLVGSDWQDWTKVYLAGGSASEWAGARPNDTAQDLDILIGVNYFEARRGSGAFQDMDSSQIDTAFNSALRAAFNDPDWHPAFGGTWQLTGYVNPDAYDITKIKPYAAYNITDMTWAVHPPHLPEHTLADFDPAILAMARAMATEARAILRMPEPARTHEARALWERLHSDRRRAFSDEGEGWQDPGNLIEKYLAYAPGKLLEQIRELALAPPLSKAAAVKLAIETGVWWHGTPDERTWETGAAYGIHIGTEEAARTALHARIGKPAEGEWDGTREYGKTLLNRDQVHHTFDPETRTFTRHVEHHPPSYPNGEATYSTDAAGGTPKIPLDARPNVFPVRIKGPMTNSPHNPHPDFHANGYMRGQLRRGRAKSGYYYTNVSEDEGSVSAVVPSASHLERIERQPKTAAAGDLTAGQFRPLEKRLLGKGGTRVVNPGFEPDLDKILQRGQDWDGSDATRQPMRSRDCHANAARLCEAKGHQIATGYALSDDGLWRQHSWGIHAKTGKPIETTTPREKYHGVVLTADEAAEFGRANPSHTAAAEPRTTAVEPYDEDGEPRPWHRRWPGESKEDATARRGQYTQQVADRHGVSPAAAHKAITRVAGDLDEDLAFTDGRKYGFANNPGHHEIFSENQIKHLMTPELWHGVPVTHVSTEGLQASQNWLRPRTLAHNLFHPGKKLGQVQDEEGHPDFDPDDLPREEEDYDDIDEGSRPRPDLGQHTRFLRRDDGSMMVVDGHHRAAIDMALGKQTTPGTVIDEPKLRAAMGSPAVHLHGEEMSAQDLHAHMLEHHDRTRSELPEPRDANHLDLVDEHDHSHEFEDPGHEHQLPESAHERGRIPAAVIDKYAAADSIYIPPPLPEEALERARTHPHQVAASYAQYHARMNHPRVTMRFPRSHEGGDELVGSILRHTGYEGGTEGSFVARHPRPENKTSNPSWLDGKPGVALHPDSWDYGTVAHEAAHHALMYHHAIGLNEHQPDEQIHGPEWSGYYARGLNYISPGAGDEFLAHKQHYLEEIAARTSQAKTASSDGDGWVTCEQGCEHWGKHGAAGLLIRHRGEDGLYRYLLQKRSDDGDAIDNPGVWSIPSGAIGRHETPEEGAKREYREEHGPLPQGVTHHHTVKSTDHGNWSFHTVVMDSPERFEPRGGGETGYEQQGAAWHTAAEVRGMKNRGELHPAFAESWDAVRRSRGPKEAAVGPAYYHGTYAERVPGDLIEPGHQSNYVTHTRDRKREHVFAVPGFYQAYAHAMNAVSKQRRRDKKAGVTRDLAPHVYHVEFTGPHEMDEEDERSREFIGSEDKASRQSRHPLRVIDEVVFQEGPQKGSGRLVNKSDQSLHKTAQATETQATADYRQADSQQRRCGGCVMFRRGKKHDWCTKVKGSIEADHVCRFFYAKGKTAAAPARGYHVSWHDFAPGDLVETGHEHNFPDDEDYDRHAHNYLLTDEDAAHDFADRLHQHELDEYGAQNARPRPRIYPVETTGPHEVDPEDPSHHDYYGPPVSRRSKSPLRVLQAAAVDESAAIDRPDLSVQGSSEKPQVYLRFGDWHHSETSRNYVTGDREFGVSVYDLDHRGQPKDPDPGFDRIHEHNEHCEPGCDEDQWNEDYGNDTGEEMRDRVHRAEKARYRGGHESDRPHLVTGDEVGIGHDGESLLKNVRRVGDWIDHRHLFIPGAERHRLARDENDPEYEPPAEDPRGFRVQGVAGYDVAPRTGMIYLDVPSELIKPVPGGVDDHHITVVYLGKGLSDEQFEEACRRAQEAASRTHPLQGELRGTETFPPSESSKGKTPAFVPARVPGLDALRGELEDLSASEHGFHPHVTLAYLEDGDEVPPPHPATPVRFTHLHVKRGDDIKSFPLGGDLAKEADYRQPPTEETWEARRQRVSKWLDKQGEIFHLPSKWGPHTSNQVAHGLIADHGGPERDEHWEHLPDQEVSLRQPVHTHQGYVYTDTVKHYLNADADPDQYYESGEYTPGGDEAKFVKHNGTHYLLDGHHRYAKDRLMGHESMYGKVFDTANPEHKQANCYECHRDEAEDDYDHASENCPTCQQHGWYV